MSFRDWLSPRRTHPAPSYIGAAIDQHRSAPVDTGSASVCTGQQQGDHQADPDDRPMIFGALRSPKEHAIKLREYLGSALGERSVYVGDLEHLHRVMCQELCWIPRRWPAVGRELSKLDGVRKGKVWVNGERLTVYGFGTPVETVVEFAAVERRVGSGARIHD